MAIPSSQLLRLDHTNIFAVLRSLLLAKYIFKETYKRPFASHSTFDGVGALAALDKEKRLQAAHDAVVFFGCETAVSPQELADMVNLVSWCERISGVWERTAKQLVFMTSGSTGVPKKHAYSFDVLEEEAEALAPYFADRRRIVTVMPTHHIFGFVTSVLLAKQLGIPVLRLPPLPVAELFQSLEPGDLFVAFPIFWQAVLERIESQNTLTGELPRQLSELPTVTDTLLEKPQRIIVNKLGSYALPADFMGLSSSAPCPPEIIENLTTTVPRTEPYCVRFAEIYGSTETSAVGIRTACRAPYTLLPLWERTDGEDKNGGPQIVRVYRNGKREAAIPMPDFVEWANERAFTPVRRKDNAVQVGGFNVYPQNVVDIIRTHPAVKDCAVRLMRPGEGVRLKVFIVPAADLRNKGRAAFGTEFKAWLRERLDTPAVPKSITLGNALPVTKTGKSSDWAVCGDTDETED